MATHRRESTAHLTPGTLLGMAASVLLILVGILAAVRSPHLESGGPLFQPLAVTSNAPPGPLILLDEPQAPAPVTPSARPSAAPHSVSYPQDVRNAAPAVKPASKPSPTVTPLRKFSPPSTTPTVSIQKVQDDQQTFRAPTPDGRCSGTASQCLDNVESAPLTQAPDIGIDAHGLLCLIFANTDCKERP